MNTRFHPDITYNQHGVFATIQSGMTLSGIDFLSYKDYDDIIVFHTDRQKKQMEFLHTLGLEKTESIIPFQIHSTNILEVQSADIVQANTQNIPYIIEGDGIYSFDSNILLGVSVADCVGIILYEPKTRFIAALHSGWRASVGYATNKNQQQSIIQRCVEECIFSHNISLAEISVWISPSAKSCCYEIGEEIAHYFEPYPQALKKRNNTIYADISAYIYAELCELGFQKNNIYRDPRCSICDTKFHSHRRDATKSGRALVYISQ